jgi:chemotaxis protein MotB
LKTLPNSLLIEGHTDSTPYSDQNGYSNWDLSADRANSARRLLQLDGVRTNQVTQVRGYADQMLRVKSNPTDPSNRRVSILVKNDNDPVPILFADKIVNGSTPLPGEPGGAKTAPAESKAANAAGNEGKPADGGSAQVTTPAAQWSGKPANSGGPAAPAPAKPAAGVPGAKTGLLARMKSLLPGSKK